MTIVFPDRLFTYANGKQKYGCMLDPTLKYNIDHFLIKGVEVGHDAIIAVTGLEGCQPAGSKVLMSNV